MLNMAPSIHNAHKDYYMATCEFHLRFVEWHEYEYGIIHILRNQPRGHNYQNFTDINIHARSCHFKFQENLEIFGSIFSIFTTI